MGVGFDDGPKSDFEFFDTLTGGFDEELALIFADVLPQEVKALIDVRDGGFVG